MSDIRNLIFSANDIASDTVVVPEWGDVRLELRAMSAKARADVVEHASNNGVLTDVALFHALTLVYGVYDPDTGAQVFEQSDCDGLMLKAAGVVERLANNILRLSGMTQDAEDALGKGSTSTHTADSSTN